jgi:hypothetical protein
MAVDAFALLDEAQCEEWVARVMLLSRHWRRRHPAVPFYSLGMAAYLDAPGGQGAYRDRDARERSNTLIETHFGPLLETVRACLQEHCALPARLAREAALPGFHIHLPHPVFAQPVASVHRDLQYRDVFPGQEFHRADLLSFTLPLSTPSGSGLNLWRKGVMPDFIPYRSGRMVVHDGLTTHQAVLSCPPGGLERVMLQGHTARLDGELLLYW